MTEETKAPPVHVRTIRVDVARAGEHELEITATLVDERPRDNPRWFGAEPPRVIHDMRLGLRVRHPDLVITEARSEMASHPYPICPDARPAEVAPWFVNTCRAWRENGPLHRLIQAGDEAGPRGLSA